MLAPRRLHSERPLSPVFAPLLHFSGVYRLLTTELLVLSSIRQLRSGCVLTVVSSFSMLITHNDVLTTEYRIKKIYEYNKSFPARTPPAHLRPNQDHRAG